MLTTAAVELNNVGWGVSRSPCKVVVDSSGSRAGPLLVSIRVARSAAIPVCAGAFGFWEEGKTKYREVRLRYRKGTAGNGTFRTCVLRNVWQGMQPLAGIAQGRG